MPEEFRIVEWDKRYEVDDKGHPYQPGRTKRKGPLEFIRLKANGRRQGVGWRRLLTVAGKARAASVFGIYCKLLEIAGAEELENRNRIPCPNETAFAMGFPVPQVKFAYRVMLKLGWLEPISQEFPEVPESPGESLYQPTKSKQPIQYKSTNEWLSLRDEVGRRFGSDGGIGRLLQSLGARLVSQPDSVPGVVARLRVLLEESKPKSKPAGWFYTAARREFGE